MIVLYPPFLALALDTKLTHPFAKRPVRIGLTIVSVSFALAVVFSGSRIVVILFYSMVTVLFIMATSPTGSGRCSTLYATRLEYRQPTPTHWSANCSQSACPNELTLNR